MDGLRIAMLSVNRVLARQTRAVLENNRIRLHGRNLMPLAVVDALLVVVSGHSEPIAADDLDFCWLIRRQSFKFRRIDHQLTRVLADQA